MHVWSLPSAVLHWNHLRYHFSSFIHEPSWPHSLQYGMWSREVMVQLRGCEKPLLNVWQKLVYGVWCERFAATFLRPALQCTAILGVWKYCKEKRSTWNVLEICGIKAIYSVIMLAKKIGAWVHQLWVLLNLYVTIFSAALITSELN